MMINALNSRRAGVHGRPRGRAVADVGERRRRPGGPRRRGPPHAHLRIAGGQGLPARRADRDPRRPAARLAPGRVGDARRRRARCRPACSTSGCSCSTTGAETLRRGSGPYLYLAKLESHHEARLWNEVFVHGQVALGHPARLHPGDRPDRDDPGRVRDGRDPVRAARARRRAQRRPLGLPLQRDQEAPLLAGPRPARSRRS